jgi:hypothetical protein
MIACVACESKELGWVDRGFLYMTIDESHGLACRDTVVCSILPRSCLKREGRDLACACDSLSAPAPLTEGSESVNFGQQGSEGSEMGDIYFNI